MSRRTFRRSTSSWTSPASQSSAGYSSAKGWISSCGALSGMSAHLRPNRLYMLESMLGFWSPCFTRWKTERGRLNSIQGKWSVCSIWSDPLALRSKCSVISRVCMLRMMFKSLFVLLDLQNLKPVTKSVFQETALLDKNGNSNSLTFRLLFSTTGTHSVNELWSSTAACTSTALTPSYSGYRSRSRLSNAYKKAERQ